MSVNTYLQDLASDLVLSSSEKANITISLGNIKRKLETYFGGEVLEKKVFGSYERGTILPRSVDDDSDVDLMVVFKNSNGYKPQTFLAKLKNFVEFYYSRSEIYQSSPSIVLELQHIKFELTPAYSLYGNYYIPNGQSDWISTDPDGFSDILVDCNKNNGNKIKPIIRILKHWNIQKNAKDIASFELERTIAKNLRYEYYTSTTYVEYAKAAFETIKSQTDYSKVNNAINHINKAVLLEKQGMIYPALEEIKKSFPEI